MPHGSMFARAGIRTVLLSVFIQNKKIPEEQTSGIFMLFALLPFFGEKGAGHCKLIAAVPHLKTNVANFF